MRSLYRTSGFFLLRTPLLAFDELLDWSEGLAAPGTPADALPAALEADRCVLRDRLRRIVSRSEVQEALFLASPSLHDSLSKWLDDPDSRRGERTEAALVRYLYRMAGRPEPFGLLAGFSVGFTGTTTDFRMAATRHYERHVRLDSAYVWELVEQLTRDRDVRSEVRFFPNSSAYKVGGRYRYAEARHQGHGERSYLLAEVTPTDHLETVLARAKSGATIAQLADALVEGEAGASAAEATAYVHDLIDSQLLVPEIQARVTGPGRSTESFGRLREGPTSAARIAAALAEVDAACEDLTRQPLGASAERYLALSGALPRLEEDHGRALGFHVDMRKPVVSATVGPEVLMEVLAAADVLNRITPPLGQAALQEFCDSVIEHYGDRPVRLVEALDPEVGVGFGQVPDAPLQELLGVDEGPRNGIPAVEAWGPREAALLAMLARTLLDRRHEMVLGPADVKELESPSSLPLPDAFAALVSVMGTDASVSGGDFRLIIKSITGPSGARMMGRFCNSSAELRRLVDAHLRDEEALQPDAAFAEIVHVAEGRIGNVVCRPVLREWEIPYLGRSGADRARQIDVDDLFLSIRDRRIELYSRTLRRRVIPRLTSAHNFGLGGLPLYRFLCVLQGQGISQAVWDWGPLKSAGFLPRVRVGRAVLSPAQWRLDASGVERILGSRNGPDRYRAVQDWREAERVPRWVALQGVGRALPVDLANMLSVSALADNVRGQKEAVLSEMLPSPEDLCVKGPEGRFFHDLVLPFVRTRPADVSGVPVRAPRALEHAAPSPPGSEWLYAKVYGGISILDEILVQVVAPFAKDAVASGMVDRWFFVRYGDPHPHLRVRLHGPVGGIQTHVRRVLEEATSPLVHAGHVWRLQLDTYQPETERYGGPDGLQAAERLFHVDSEAVLAVLTELPGVDARARLFLTIRGVHLLLAALGFEPEARESILSRLRAALADEFKRKPLLKLWINDKFRRDRALLESVLDESVNVREWTGALEAQRLCSQKLASVRGEITRLASMGRLSVAPDRLGASFVHMHINRMLKWPTPTREAILLDLILRAYKARRGRLRTETAGGRCR